MTNKSPYAIVSGGDSRYMPLLRELVQSILRFEESANFDICILDAGLMEDQVQEFKSMGIKVVSPDWPDCVNQSKIKGRTFLKSCLCRPFINHIFPDYKTYIWLDGDTWVQDWSAIELLLKGAERAGMAVVPQVDRAYDRGARMKWLWFMPWKPRSFYYSNARIAFSGKLARKLFPYPTINAGVFAVKGNAPHWDHWQALMAKALVKGKPFTAEQLTMGIMLYLDGLDSERLPAWCNWMCEYKAIWDDSAKRFTEPYLPHHPLGIVHLTGSPEMRQSRSVIKPFETLGGKIIETSYRYPFYNGETGEPIFKARAA